MNCIDAIRDPTFHCCKMTNKHQKEKKAYPSQKQPDDHLLPQIK